MGEFLKRAAAPFNPSDDNVVIEGMIDQMVKTAQAANIALDDALAYVEQSNKRIAAMESQRNDLPGECM